MLRMFAGGDLVFKDLKARIEYPSGSHAVLCGHELYHFSMPYQGKRRFVVLTMQESVRQSALTIE